MFEVGQLLNQRYRLEQLLGRGGMGQVFLAQDLYLERSVAIKTQITGEQTEDRALRFVNEAQISGQLTHPNVVTIHELGRHKGASYLVMKYIQGRDLKSELSQWPKTLSEQHWQSILRWFAVICEAVSSAHEKGLVHRDLKPANIMIRDNGEALLMDWGLARSIKGRAGSVVSTKLTARLQSIGPSGTTSADLTQQGALIGTPAYMPPEQLDDPRQLDGRADVYALGATLYELVCGQAPYSGNTLEVLKQLISGPPPRPRERAPERHIPAPLEAIIVKAMAPQAEHRYASARELVADLRAYRDGRLVQAYEESVAESLRRWLSKHKALCLLIGASLMGLFMIQLSIRVVLRDKEQRLQTSQSRLELSQRSLQESETRQQRDLEWARLQQMLSQLQAVGVRARRRLRRVSINHTEVGAESFKKSRSEDPYEAFQERFQSFFNPMRPVQLKHDSELVRQLFDLFLLSLKQVRSADTEDSPLGVELRQQAEDWQWDLQVDILRALLKRNVDEAWRILDSQKLTRRLPILTLRALYRNDMTAEGRAFLASVDDSMRTAMKAQSKLRRFLCLEAMIQQRPASECLALAEQALKQEEREPWLLLIRAELFCRTGQFERAEREFYAVKLLDPDDPRVNAVHLQWGMPLVVASGLRVRLLESAFRVSPWLRLRYRGLEALRTLLAHGRARRAPEDLAKARAAWTTFKTTLLEARAADPLRRLINTRVLVQGALQLGRWAEAGELLKEALTMDPEDPRVLTLQAQLEFHSKDYEACDRRLEALLSANPENARANGLRGQRLLQQGNPKAALKFLKHCAQSSLSSDDWRTYGLALMQAGGSSSLDLAQQALRRALALDTETEDERNPLLRALHGHPEVNAGLGRVALLKGQRAEAVLQYFRAYQKAASRHLPDSLRSRQVLYLSVIADIHRQWGLLSEARLVLARAQKVAAGYVKKGPGWAQRFTFLKAIEAALKQAEAEKKQD